MHIEESGRDQKVANIEFNLTCKIVRIVFNPTLYTSPLGCALTVTSFLWLEFRVLTSFKCINGVASKCCGRLCLDLLEKVLFTVVSSTWTTVAVKNCEHCILGVAVQCL